MQGDTQDLQQSLSFKRIGIPIAIGVMVVGVLFWHKFDASAMRQIQWNRLTILFFMLALLCLIIRLGAYARRLMLLSDGAFSFRKALQLIFIWEFSSAVSPTNVGGSAVALVVLAQEKIGAARTATIVIYTIILDTAFVMIALPIWYCLYGSQILGRGDFAGYSAGGWEATLLVAYLLMCSYGMFLLYALVRKPKIFERIAAAVSRIRFLRRYREQLLQLGENITLASRVLFQQSLSYHIKAFFYTVVAWSSRFLLIICLVAGFVQQLSWSEVVPLFARIQTMFVLMAFSPTPGGAGIAEVLFDTLLSDVVPGGIGVVLATIWRGMAYYFFILMGVIILPGWLGQQVARRRQKQ
ncbi:MAG: flippase-like domain-containing protein [Saprospiraceae bacterium]|nr:flippase-like domain-containing protein [Saprospiraceae bacterium]